MNGRFGVLRFSKSIFLDGATGHSAALVHEIGHAILGMCHISAETVGGCMNPTSLMATSPQGTINLPSRLAPFDIEAAQTIYGSPLSPGVSAASLQRPERCGREPNHAPADGGRFEYGN